MPEKSGTKKTTTICRNVLPRASPLARDQAKDSDDVDGTKFESLVAQLITNFLSNPQTMELLAEYFNQQGHVLGCKSSRARNVTHCEVIRPRDLPLVTGLSRTQCWRLSRDPNSGFPAKIRLSSGAIGYSRQQIEMWLITRMEANHE